MYTLSLITTNEMRTYINAEVGDQLVNRMEVQLPALPVHMGGVGSGVPSPSVQHRINCAAKPTVKGVAATLPFQLIQALLLAIGFVNVSISLIREQIKNKEFEYYSLGTFILTLMSLWFLYITVQVSSRQPHMTSLLPGSSQYDWICS